MSVRKAVLASLGRYKARNPGPYTPEAILDSAIRGLDFEIAKAMMVFAGPIPGDTGSAEILERAIAVMKVLELLEDKDESPS